MNAEAKTLGCDRSQLESYLNGDMPDDAAQLVEDHLATCGSCRDGLQALAASSEDWLTARNFLPPDELDREQIESGASWGAGQALQQREATMLSREIRGWLDPTDDPKSLGRFAGYEIVGIVGHGGMGIVLKGFEESLNRFVAIKVLAPRLATNATARKRFAREAQAAAAVLHENVIAIHRVDEWHDLPFLVMPYVGGISLQKRIDQEGPLSIEATLRVGLQIAAGLAAAHEQGLVHRDIKPANILLDHGVERVTITDFGLARAADDASMTRTGIIAGTPQYMSPEQAEAKAVDARSDLFSLGSVLYTMASGRPPFRGDGSFEVLKRIGSEPARSLRDIDPAIPGWFEKLVVRLHAKSADARPQSAHEVQRLLNGCLLHSTQPNQMLPRGLSESVVARLRRRWWLAAGVGLAAVILAGLLFLAQPPANDSESSDGAIPAAEVTPPAANRGKQLGKVLDKTIYESDLNKNVSMKDNLQNIVIRPLMEDYCKKHGLDPAATLKAKIKDEKSRMMARYFVLQAGLQRHLYEKYGGRVLLSAFGPTAYDGMKKWIEERQRVGDLQLTDSRLRQELDELWTEDAENLTFASPSQIKAAFDPAITDRFIASFANIPRGAYRDPALKLVGEALGLPIHVHERYLANGAELTEILHGLFVGRLEEHYRKQHPEVEPTAAEIDALAALQQRNVETAKRVYREGIAKLESESKDLKAGSDEYLELESQKQVLERKLSSSDARGFAAFVAPGRKFHIYLYKNYGGGRGLRTPQGMEAIDVQKRWVEEREKLGEFQIADPKIRDKFYEYWDKAEERLGDRLIDDPNQLKAWSESTWIEATPKRVMKTPPGPAIGAKTVVTRPTIVSRSPASIRFPTQEIAALMTRFKKKEDTAASVKQLRRITGLDLQATFTAMKPPSYEPPTEDPGFKRTLSLEDSKETGTASESPEKAATIYPGRPAKLNFRLTRKQ